MANVIVLDASVLIAYLDSSDAHHQDATQLLIAQAALPLGMSVINLAEVLVAPARAGRLDEVSSILAELGIEPVGVEDEDAPALARLRATTALRMPDCCALLAAKKVDGELATFDSNLAARASDVAVSVVSLKN